MLRNCRAFLALLVFLAVWAAPDSVGAQISGVLWDSLRAQGPLAAQRIALLGTAEVAVTDSFGRFHFARVPAGATGIGFWSPWLDSIGLGPLRVAVPAPRMSVLLATPSRSAHQRALCGVAFGADRSVLIGELRDPTGAPVANSVVAAVWSEFSAEGNQLTQAMLAAADTTASSGMFELCGLPIGSVVELRTSGNGLRSGPVLLTVSEPELRRDLVAARTSDQSIITGQVVRHDSTVVASASVGAVGIDGPGRSATSDQSGRFRLRGPSHSFTIEVHAIGHPPRLVTVTPWTDSVDVGRIILAPLPQTLRSVTITAAARLEEEFEERRALGLGVYITENEISRFPSFGTQAIRSITPRVALRNSRSRYASMLIRGGVGFCDPRFFEDGLDVGKLDALEQHELLTRAKRVEIYLATQAPPKFTDFDGCGAVVVWTR